MQRSTQHRHQAGVGNYGTRVGYARTLPLTVALLRLPVLVGGALRTRRAAARALPRMPLGAAVLILA